MFLEHVAIFQDAQMWNGKREIHSKLSRFRYLATRGGVALAVRRCVTRISSNRLGVAILGGHSPHVGEPLGAKLCSGVRGEQEGWVPRYAGETPPTKRIESH